MMWINFFEGLIKRSSAFTFLLEYGIGLVKKYSRGNHFNVFCCC